MSERTAMNEDVYRAIDELVTGTGGIKERLKGARTALLSSQLVETAIPADSSRRLQALVAKLKQKDDVIEDAVNLMTDADAQLIARQILELYSSFYDED